MSTGLYGSHNSYTACRMTTSPQELKEGGGNSLLLSVSGIPKTGGLTTDLMRNANQHTIVVKLRSQNQGLNNGMLNQKKKVGRFLIG